MNAKPSWMNIATYRACELCMHVQAGPQPLCGCPDAHLATTPQPVHQVRALGGGCGPDAEYLVMKGWQ